MRKLNTILGILALTSTTACANPYGGLFAGVGLGGAMQQNQTKYIDATTGNGKTTFSKAGAYYQIHAGYLHEVGTSKTLVGFDVYLNSSSAKKQGNVGVNGQPVAGILEQKRGAGYGIALIAGKLVNPKVMLYARLGYETAKYKMKLTPTGQAPQESTVSYNGMVPGVGVNYKLASNILAGVGYDYAGMFSNKDVYKKGNISVQVKPVEHRVMVKVSFVFNSFL